MLFTLDEVKTTLSKPNVVPREIQWVSNNLDRTSDASRAFYFLKNNVGNPEHPFKRFSAGSRTTLQTVPAEKGIDVPSELLRFFRDHYLSTRATLVVVGKDDLGALDRWISPFSNIMSQKASLASPRTYRQSFPDSIASDSKWRSPSSCGRRMTCKWTKMFRHCASPRTGQ